MLTLRGIITLIVLIVLFALAVVWISKQGGWKGEPPDIACWQRPGAFCFQLSVSR